MNYPFLYFAGIARRLLFPCALLLPQVAPALAEPQQIVNPYPAAGDHFGTSIALWHKRLVVGAAEDDPPSGGADAGAVFVYQQQPGGAWTLAAELSPSDPSAGAMFGGVATHGDTIVVGASRKDGYIGAAYVFERRAGAWTEVVKLAPSSPTTTCGNPDGYCHLFGTYVAVENDIAAVSAHAENGLRGAIYVFRRSPAGTGWELEARIASPSSALGQFGYRVRIHDGRIAVGAPGIGTGAAYLFTRQGQTWQLEATLQASDGASSDGFGISVDLDADRVLVGAYRASTAGGAHCGAAYVYERDGHGQWPQTAKLTASDCVPGVAGSDGGGDQLGTSVHWYQGEAYVARHPGVYSYPHANRHGAVYRFRQTTPGSWEEVEQFTPSSAAPGDGFGYDLASYGDVLAAGAAFEGSPADEAAHRGSVFVYDLTPADRIFADAFDGPQADCTGCAAGASAGQIRPHRHGVAAVAGRADGSGGVARSGLCSDAARRNRCEATTATRSSGQSSAVYDASARTCPGVRPVQPLNARWKVFASVKSSR